MIYLVSLSNVSKAQFSFIDFAHYNNEMTILVYMLIWKKEILGC